MSYERSERLDHERYLEEQERERQALESVLKEVCGVVRDVAALGLNSLHEGYAVLLEEVDELWRETKRKQRDSDAIRIEAVQIAAVAVMIARRFGSKK